MFTYGALDIFVIPGESPTLGIGDVERNGVLLIRGVIGHFVEFHGRRTQLVLVRVGTVKIFI